MNFYWFEWVNLIIYLVKDWYVLTPHDTFFVMLDLAAVIAWESHRSSCRNRLYSNHIYCYVLWIKERERTWKVIRLIRKLMHQETLIWRCSYCKHKRVHCRSEFCSIRGRTTIRDHVYRRNPRQDWRQRLRKRRQRQVRTSAISC